MSALVNQDWPYIKRLLGYSARYKGRIVLAGIASLGVAGSDVAAAKLVQPFVDNLLIKPNPSLIKLVPLIIVAIAFLKGFSRYGQGYFIKTAGQLVVQDLRNELFSSCMGLSMRYYSKNPSSTIISRVLNNVGVLQRSATEDIVDLIRESITLVGLIGLVFYTDAQLALVAFVILPIAIFPASMIGRKIKNYTDRGLKSIAMVTGVLQESLAGIKVIKAFGTENYERGRFENENFLYYKNFRKVLKYDAAAKPVVELLASLGAAAVLWFGLNRVAAGELTQGEFSSFLAAMMLMYNPVKSLTKINANLQRSLSAAQRIFELMDEPSDIVEVPDAVNLERCKGKVEFSEVDFAYDNQPVLKNFSLSVQPGEIVALVGPSGAGKSTVAGLLTRFYDPQAGSVLIDGHDIRGVTLDSLRQNLGFVDQETVLFNTTILDNIRYGSPGATEEQVREAARQAYADDFVLPMEDSYMSNVGDRGLRLSGGQRQRLCIARAILRNAPILILDEATSALDTESEVIVQKALANLMKDRTTFIIAHRLSTVMSADKIVVMEDGSIREIGSHNELLQAGGLYSRLYEMQFNGGV